jgi:hypothetical protein
MISCRHGTFGLAKVEEGLVRVLQVPHKKWLTPNPDANE